jgi:hypothetical protein
VSIAESEVITSSDAFQLKASYKLLASTLDAWAVEMAQVQLGSEPQSVVAVTGFNDQQLGRLAQVSSAGADAVKSFKKNRDLLAQNLFLARGAARYEKDPAVARNYADTARTAALAAQSDLAALAREAGVEVASSPSSGPAAAPEDAIKFTPQVAPKEESRLIL